MQIENEGPAIVVTAAARVPVPVRHRANPFVVLRQAQQRGINRLFFRTNQAHLHFAVAESKHLRPKHGGVGDAHQLELLFPGERAGDDEEPGTIGRPVHVRGLDRPVDLPFLRIETVKVQFRRGRQRLDDIFQRIVVGPAQQIEEQGRDFRVGEELGIDLTLLEVLADGMVIGKVAVMHQGHVNGRKRMGAARVPDAALGRETLVGNPFVRAQVLNLVVLDDRFGEPDDLEDHDVPPMREHEGPFLPERRVVFLIQAEAVLVDKLGFRFLAVQRLQIVPGDERVQHLRFDAHKIAADRRRHHLKPRHGLPVFELVELAGRGDVEVRGDELRLDFGPHLGVNERQVQQVMAVEDFAADPKLLGDQPHRGDAASLAIAPVVHLAGRFIDMLARHRLAATETHDPAAPFLGFLLQARGVVERLGQPSSGIGQALYQFTVHEVFAASLV